MIDHEESETTAVERGPIPSRLSGASRERSRLAPRRLGVALAALAFSGLAAACGDEAEADGGADGDAAPSPELHSEVAFLPGLAEGELAAGGIWAPDTPVGPPLPALSSAEEIKAAVEAAHGRTNDVTQEMSRFLAFPKVPTPPRAEITEIRADVRNGADGQSRLVAAEATFVADGSVDDLIELYRADLEGQGWGASGQSERVLDGLVTRRVGFTIPGTGYHLDDVEVMVRAHLGSPGRSLVIVRYTALADPGDDSGQQRFAGWADGFPLPEGGEITGAGIQTSAVVRNSLHYFLAVTYDELSQGELSRSLRDTLPSGSFELDEGPRAGSADNWVYLANPFFDDAWVSTHQATSDPGPPTRLNIDARVEFTPAT